MLYLCAIRIAFGCVPVSVPAQEIDYLRHNVAKWLSSAAKYTGLEQGKTFHFYLYTVAEKLRGLEAQGYIIKRILGHSTQSKTHDRHGSNNNFCVLTEAIKCIKYGRF